MIIETACKLDLSVDTGIIYPLSKCCKASAKGSGNGIVCRACYRPLPDRFGMAADNWVDLSDLLQAFSCPCPDDCAQTVWHQIEESDEAWFELAK